MKIRKSIYNVLPYDNFFISKTFISMYFSPFFIINTTIQYKAKTEYRILTHEFLPNFSYSHLRIYAIDDPYIFVVIGSDGEFSFMLETYPDLHT